MTVTTTAFKEDLSGISKFFKKGKQEAPPNREGLISFWKFELSRATVEWKRAWYKRELIALGDMTYAPKKGKKK